VLEYGEQKEALPDQRMAPLKFESAVFLKWGTMGGKQGREKRGGGRHHVGERIARLLINNSFSQ